MMRKIIALLPLLFLTACATPSQEVLDTAALNKSKTEVAAAEQKVAEEKSWHEAELARYKSLTASLQVVYTFGGIAISLALLVGLTSAAYYGAQAIRTRASIVYPNVAGQFPIVITRGIGYEAIRNPNIQISTNSSLALPTPTQKILSLKSGEAIQPLLIEQPDKTLQLRANNNSQYLQMLQALNQDPGTRSAMKKGLIKAAIQEPEPEAITGEFSFPREFKVIERTGTKTL